MNIYAKKGDKVTFEHYWGYDCHAEAAREAGFVIGHTYTVARDVEPGQSISFVELEGFRGHFNTVQFEDVPANEPAPTPANGAIERALAIKYHGRYTCLTCKYVSSPDINTVRHIGDCKGEAALAEARELREEVARLRGEREYVLANSKGVLDMSFVVLQQRNEAVALLREQVEPITIASVIGKGGFECRQCGAIHTRKDKVPHADTCPWHKRTVFLAGIDGEEKPK